VGGYAVGLVGEVIIEFSVVFSGDDDSESERLGGFVMIKLRVAINNASVTTSAVVLTINLRRRCRCSMSSSSSTLSPLQDHETEGSSRTDEYDCNNPSRPPPPPPPPSSSSSRRLRREQF